MIKKINDLKNTQILEMTWLCYESNLTILLFMVVSLSFSAWLETTEINPFFFLNAFFYYFYFFYLFSVLCVVLQIFSFWVRIIKLLGKILVAGYFIYIFKSSVLISVFFFFVILIIWLMVDIYYLLTLILAWH